MRAAVLMPFMALGLAACGGPDPVADGANNVVGEVVLPPDESVATPTNELESGYDEEVINAAENSTP